MKILAQLSNRGPLGEFGTEALPAALMVGPAIPSQWALQSTLLFFLDFSQWAPQSSLLAFVHCAALIAGPAILCPVFPAVPVLMDNKTIKKVVS